MKHVLPLLALLLTFPLLAQAQLSLDRDVVAAAGSSTSSPSLHLSWTVGEVATQTHNNTLVLTEGFQQADALPVGLIDRHDIAAAIRVFPNPVQNLLQYEVEADRPLKLQVDLFDLQGRLVKSISPVLIRGSYHHQIDMRELPSGDWLLRFVEAGGRFSRSFVINKVH